MRRLSRAPRRRWRPKPQRARGGGGLVVQTARTSAAAAAAAIVVTWCAAASTGVARAEHPPFSAASEHDASSFSEVLATCGDETREALDDARAWLAAHTRWSLDDADRARFVDERGLPERTATFGHATVAGAASIVAEWHKKRRHSQDDRPVLVDLGAGAGHVALYGALIDRDAAFRGVELAAARVDVADRALAYLDSAYPDLALADRVAFEAADMLSVDVTDASGVFVSSLMLGDDLKRRLAAKLKRELRAGAVVIASSDLLGGDPEWMATFVAPMSWAPSHTLVSRVVPPLQGPRRTSDAADDLL